MRSASTVILVRESKNGPQVYLLRRSGKSRFFPDLYVFPGGTFDQGDTSIEFWEGHIETGIDELSTRLGNAVSARKALGFHVSAIRETFEEAGILLGAGDKPNPVLFQEVCRMRSRQALKESWLQEAADQGDWILKLTDLVPWARWVTPLGMKYRYDTLFFVAPMPEEQACSPDFLELTHGLWASPLEGLESNSRGAIPLSPPTVVTLQQLVSCRTLEGVFERAKQNSLDAILPRLVAFGRDRVILEPWDPLWAKDEDPPDPRHIRPEILPPGEPFSRVWLQKGLCRPIR